MQKIALSFTYYTDIIEMTDEIAKHIKKYQNAFDKWLYDKNNEHGLWVYINGKKKAVSFDSSDFVNYLNTYIIRDNNMKVRIVQSGLEKTPSDIPVLFF